MTAEPARTPASLEALVETGMLPLESLHPGGLDLTRELAERCGIRRGDRVLDVASGTGETACFLAGTIGARVFGVDRSDAMLRRAAAKARDRDLRVELANAGATDLPFADGEFDAALCECTLCFLDKERALAEMARVLRPGGRLGMHDLCWKKGAPEGMKRTLAEVEGERPEELEGWRRLFAGAGLVDIEVVDRSELIGRWMRESRKRLGVGGYLKLVLAVVRRWGVGGLWRVLRSEGVFSSERLGYGIVVGTKP